MIEDPLSFCPLTLDFQMKLKIQMSLSLKWKISQIRMLRSIDSPNGRSLCLFVSEVDSHPCLPTRPRVTSHVSRPLKKIEGRKWWKMCFLCGSQWEILFVVVGGCFFFCWELFKGEPAILLVDLGDFFGGGWLFYGAHNSIYRDYTPSETHL